MTNKYQKYRIDRSTVLLAPLPERTSTYRPVSNKRLLDAIEDKLQAYCYPIDHVKFSGENGGIVMVGEYFLESTEVLNGIHMGVYLSVQNSYDKSRAIRISTGIYSVDPANPECQAPHLNGKVFEMRKHTKNVMQDLDEMITTAVASLHVMKERGKNLIQKMNYFFLSKDQIKYFIGDMLMDKALTPTTINRLRTEMVKGLFAMNEPMKSTLWQLMNCISLATIDDHPRNRISQAQALYKRCMNYRNEVVIVQRKKIGKGLSAAVQEQAPNGQKYHLEVKE